MENLKRDLVHFILIFTVLVKMIYMHTLEIVLVGYVKEMLLILAPKNDLGLFRLSSTLR